MRSAMAVANLFFFNFRASIERLGDLGSLSCTFLHQVTGIDL